VHWALCRIACTGIVTETQLAGIALRLYAVDAVGEPGLFVFGAEVEDGTLYLPLVER